ncbi:MAG: AAA family ATPase [Candidatus Manganitrophaceae bacterium]|nr:MAG: AAA family ATPase [Candidatus Manganitrophaceae bacterium]
MNYLEFYNLKEQPFSISVDNRFYFNSNQHSHALVKLRYAAEERKGLAVLVGGIGTGKTTLARRMLDELEDTKFESALLVVIHTSITSEWLLRRIAVQLGVQNPLDDKTELLSQLYNRLVEIYDSGKKAVVLIDEAQMLQRREVMEEFRGILNIELDGEKLITFVFFGLTDLDSYLALDKPLQQRIAVRYELESFTEKTTEEYIRYRLEVAGSKRELFTKGSYTTIHHYSEGIPRLINSICDNALLEGFLRKKERIDEEMIKEVISDLKLIGAEKDPV